MKVSSPEDVIISVTAECSILTQLATNNNNPDSAAFGSVRLWVTIDGKRVPVSNDDTDHYELSVRDREFPPDGVDAERDFIRTRTANGFNWLALDTGVIYDDPANGNNILHVQLWADFDTAGRGSPAQRC